MTAALVAAGHDVDVLTSKKRDAERTAPLPLDGARIHEIDYTLPPGLERLRGSIKQGESSNENAAARQPSSLARAFVRCRQRTGAFAAVRMPDLSGFWKTPAVRAAHELAERAGPWDVVLSSAGPYTPHLIGMRLRRAGLARRWLAEYRDLWTGNNIYRGLWPFTVVEHRLESKVLRTADALVAISEPMAQWIRARTDQPVHVIYNGFPESNLVEPQATPPSARLRVVYTGVLNTEGRDVESLLGAVADLRTEGVDATFEIAGTGHEPVREIAGRVGLGEGFIHHGKLSREAAIELQRSASVLALIEWHDPAAGVLTTKMYDYLAAGPPIVVTGPRGEMSQIVEGTGRGVNAGSVRAAIGETLRAVSRGELSLDPDRSRLLTYTREHQASRLCELVASLRP